VDLKLVYRTSHRGGRPCAQNPVRARVAGVGLDGVVSTDFYLDGKAIGSDGTPPFARTMPDLHGDASVGIRVSMLDGRRMTITHPVRAC
jgi:hypothetical protein